MEKVLKNPSRYVQGYGVLNKLYKYLRNLGDNAFVIVSSAGKERFGSRIEQIKDHDLNCTFGIVDGKCLQSEVDRLVEELRNTKCNIVVGVGGGAIVDTAKAVSHYAELPVALIPTTVSSNAPGSTISVIKGADGVSESAILLKQSVNAIIVDSEIICNAPVRLFVAGMGDALPVYFEARSIMRADSLNRAGGKQTLSAMGLASLCYETLLSDGLQAKIALENKCCTKAVENIIEINTYTGAIGFESGGLSVAHALYRGFTRIKEMNGAYHGEKVAFGTLVQLVLENAPQEEIDEVMQFCAEVGLPLCLSDLATGNIDNKDLESAAELACRKGSTVHLMPFEVDERSLYDAIITADALGQQFKSLFA